jgi:hypothetical protein
MSSNMNYQKSNKKPKHKSKYPTSSSRIVDNDGWTTMIRSGKPSSESVNTNTNATTTEEDEETKQMREAMELSLKSNQEYKSPEDITVEHFMKISLNDESEEEKQIREAIELSIKSHNEYKSPDEVVLDIAKRLSLQYEVDVTCSSEHDFPSLSMAMAMSSTSNMRVKHHKRRRLHSMIGK